MVSRPPMGTAEIERLYVVVESDITKLVAETKDGVHEVETSLQDMGEEGEKQTKRVGQGFNLIASVVQGVVIGAVSTLTTMVIRFGAQAVAMVRGFFQQSVAVGAQFETFGTQFQTLLGSAEAAQERIVELAEFGRLTPFELPEVVEASRMLEVFGGEALSTGEALQLVGDTAAGVNRPFQEIAFWFGRMYDALKSGRPFGEAALRLQELGILSGETRAELERLQKSGADGTEVWERFAEVTGERFAGNMERLSGTLQGIRSNIADFVVHIQRVGGQPVFEEAKESAQALLDLLEERRPEIEAMALAIGQFIADIQRFFHTALYGTLEQIEAEDVQELLDSMREIGLTLDAIIQALTRGPSLGEIGFINVLQGAVEAVNKGLDTFLLRIHEIDAWFARREAEAASMEERGRGINILGFRIGTGDAQSRAAGQEAHNKVMERYNALVEERNRKSEEMRSREEEVEEAVENTTDALEEETDAIQAMDPAIEKLLDKMGAAMIDAAFQAQERRESLLKEHKARLVEIEQDGAEDRIRINQELEEALTELAEEVAKRRAEILANAQEEHEELTREVAEKRASMQDDYNRSETRREEDHQREMIRLAQRFSDDVRGAVRARDARRLQDLRDQYSRETREREEDFRIGADRRREDFDLRMRELEEYERERHAEIDRSLQMELDKLDQYAAEKEADLREAHARELAALDEKIAAEIAKENEAYAARQEALQASLQARLQAMGLALAGEQKLTEEHARRLLEAMNRTFGIGGDIDKIMNDFMERRSQKLIVDVRMERAYQGTATGGAPYWTPGTLPDWKRATMQHGGTIVADEPTLALFGEAGPEVASFIPLDKMGQMGGARRTSIDLRISGSAPPGVGANEVNQIARVLLDAIRETGAMS